MMYRFREVYYELLSEFQKLVVAWLTVARELQINVMLIIELGFILFLFASPFTLPPHCYQILNNCLDSRSPLSCQFRVCHDA
jgi:hypothetical protein